MTEIPIQVMPWHKPDPCKPLKAQTSAAFKPLLLDYLSSLSLDSPPLSVPLSAIACTIGQSSNSVDTLTEMIMNGMSIAVVPLSVGQRQDHIDTISNIRMANTTYDQIRKVVYPLAIAVQLKGPGLRIGGLYKDVPVELTQESNVVLTTEKSWRLRGTADFLYVNFPQMGHILTVNDVILLDSGTVVLQVKTIDQTEALCQVVGAGIIQSFMTLTVPDVPILLPPLSDEDRDDIELVASLGVDIVIATHTQTSEHVREVRTLLDTKVLASILFKKRDPIEIYKREDNYNNDDSKKIPRAWGPLGWQLINQTVRNVYFLYSHQNGCGIKVWAHIETRQAADNIDAILREADAVLISRLGLTHEVDAEKLFIVQKRLISICNKVGTPVFLSSSFLSSMQVDITPSIPEIYDVTNAILDGVDGFVLRNTTTIGKHPESTVKTMARLCKEAEPAVWQEQMFACLSRDLSPPIDPTLAIALTSVEAAMKASATAIVLSTTSGRSAQVVARFRPRCPIIAVTRYGRVARQLNMWRAVIPLQYVDLPLVDWAREVDLRLQFGIEYGKEQGLIVPGDPLVLMSGWRQGAGFTNTIRLVYASDSFPWVYPHRLPKEIPEVTDSHSKISVDDVTSQHSSVEETTKPSQESQKVSGTLSKSTSISKSFEMRGLPPEKQSLTSSGKSKQVLSNVLTMIGTSPVVSRKSLAADKESKYSGSKHSTRDSRNTVKETQNVDLTPSSQTSLWKQSNGGINGKVEEGDMKIAPVKSNSEKESPKSIQEIADETEAETNNDGD